MKHVRCLLAFFAVALVFQGSQASAQDDFGTTITLPASITPGVDFTTTVVVDEGTFPDHFNYDSLTVAIDKPGGLAHSNPTLMSRAYANGKWTYTYKCKVYYAGDFIFKARGSSYSGFKKVEKDKEFTVP